MMKAIALIAVVGVLTGRASAASLVPLGFLPGQSFSTALAVSGDGSTVVGFGQRDLGGEPQAFRWTAAGGMVGMGYLPGGTFSGANGVNADGSVIVGYSSSGNAEAFRWTAATGMVGLGNLPGGISYSAANAVSADGSVVVGTAGTASGYDEAFRWTAGGGMVGLGYLSGDSLSLGTGVSGAGSVVVGFSFPLGGGGQTYRAFRWTAGTGMVPLGNLPGGNNSVANAVSADGSVVVGNGNSDRLNVEAFRWTAAGGMVGLGVIPGHNQSVANGVNGDGSVIVGWDSTPTLPTTDAFVWTAATGMQNLWDVLRAQGVDPSADGWTVFDSANAVSADGNTIVGAGLRNGNLEAFIATVPEPAAIVAITLATLPLRRRRRA